MTAMIVPAVRLRRDTSGWSYRLPRGMDIVPGVLVVVPFRGRRTLGVVWEITAEDTQATETVSEAISSEVIVATSQRRLIEWMSEAGLCSLSTALYVWLPGPLRRLPITWATRQALVPTPSGHQHGILVPGLRPIQETQLARRGSVAHLFAEDEWPAWLAVRNGVSLGLGREGALFAPWRNLTRLTVSEPEDISYYHEQIPYLSLVEAAGALARSWRITPDIRSKLPSEAARQLWGTATTGNDVLPTRLVHVDLRADPLLNSQLILAIRGTLTQDKDVIILYNAHDRLITDKTPGRQKLVPGVESMRKQLAKTLGTTDSKKIHFGTRAIFQTPRKNIGLAIALNLDNLLETSLFADKLHGWADLGHLFGYGCETIIQSHYPEHELVRALVENQWREYICAAIKRRRELGLPPFCQQIVLSAKGTVEASALYAKLHALLREAWQLSQPFVGLWRKEEYVHLMLTAPLAERLPTALRRELVALQRPWKVQRNPWHVL
jgi:primosomal protein N'